jgi:hypothetical protein
VTIATGGVALMLIAGAPLLEGKCLPVSLEQGFFVSIVGAPGIEPQTFSHTRHRPVAPDSIRGVGGRVVVVHVHAAGGARHDAILGVLRHGAGMPVAGIQEASGLFSIFLPQTVDDVSVQGHGDRGRVGAGEGTVVS